MDAVNRLYARMVCDFCSNDAPTWCFPADPITDELLRTHSPGEWLACEECARCIRTNQWTKLARRCLLAPGVMDAVVPDMGMEAAEAQVRFTVRMFRHAMRPGRRIGARELYCDFCGHVVDRVWLWRNRAFCYAEGGRREVRAGAWAACVYCRPLFESGDVVPLVARVQTLNPGLAPSGRDLTRLYRLLLATRGDEVVLWEAGQPRPAGIFEGMVDL